MATKLVKTHSAHQKLKIHSEFQYKGKGFTILPYGFTVCCADSMKPHFSRFTLGSWNSVRVMNKAQTFECFFHLHVQATACCVFFSNNARLPLDALT